MLKLEEISQFTDHPHGVEKIYENALRLSKKLPEECIFMEIGCWKGGSAMAIMQAIADSGVDRWLFTVDPYGSKPFKLIDFIQDEADYNEDLYREAMLNLSAMAHKLKVKHYHWRLTSDDFMTAVEMCEFWDKGKTIEPKFGFTYIDGDHNCYTVEREMNWLVRHMEQGMIVFDDVPYVDQHDIPIIKQALNEGFEDNFRCYWEVK